LYLTRATRLVAQVLYRFIFFIDLLQTNYLGSIALERSVSFRLSMMFKPFIKDVSFRYITLKSITEYKVLPVTEE